MYGYLVFDLDGVLVDVREGYKDWIFDQIEDEMGLSFSREKREMLWHGIGGDSRDKMLESWGVDNPRRFWDVYDRVECFDKRLEYTFAYDDTSVLDEFEVGMGIVTHSPKDLAVRVLEDHGLRRYFDRIVSCSYEIGYKPDPNPIEKCVEGIERGGGEGVMIGDSVSDIRGAWNAGLSAGHIDRKGHEVEADHCLDSLTEIHDLVRS